MTKNSERYNRDYRYVALLKDRLRRSPSELLLPKVQKRLREIHKHWTPTSETLSGEAANLLQADTSKLKPQIGSNALVSFRVRGGEIKVLCRVTAKIDPFNRYKVTPVNGHGAAVVNGVNVEFVT